MRANRLLGAALVEANLVKIEDLEAANERLLELLAGDAERQATLLGVLMYEKKVLSEDDLLHHFADNDGIGLIDLRTYDVPEEFRKERRPRLLLGHVDGALRQGGELLLRGHRLLPQPGRALPLGEAARHQHPLVRHHARGHLGFPRKGGVGEKTHPGAPVASAVPVVAATAAPAAAPVAPAPTVAAKSA